MGVCSPLSRHKSQLLQSSVEAAEIAWRVSSLSYGRPVVALQDIQYRFTMQKISDMCLLFGTTHKAVYKGFHIVDIWACNDFCESLHWSSGQGLLQILNDWAEILQNVVDTWYCGSWSEALDQSPTQEQENMDLVCSSFQSRGPMAKADCSYNKIWVVSFISSQNMHCSWHLFLIFVLVSFFLPKLGVIWVTDRGQMFFSAKVKILILNRFWTRSLKSWFLCRLNW